MKIESYPNRSADELAAIAADHINKKLYRLKGDFLFLASGGSSLVILDKLDASLFNSSSIVSVLDERYSTDPKINNFSQLMSTPFYEKAKANGTRFIDTRIINNESADALALRWQKELEKINKTIIATVGMGPDGHISGIMPFPEDSSYFNKTFNDATKLIAYYDAGKKNQYPLRITSTLPMLERTDYAVAFIVGNNKENALKKALNEHGSLAETPARIYRDMKSLDIITDIAKEKLE